MALYEVRRLSCRAGDRVILEDVSFEIAENEYVAVIGPNGAGKTTLLKHLLGIASSPRSGDILLRGRPIESYTRREAARILSYVPQHPVAARHVRVGEFVRMARYPYGGFLSRRADEDDRAVHDAFRLTATEGLKDRDLASLSGGELQKVYIAAGLAQGGDVLMLDEPATFLDPGCQHEVFTTLRAVWHAGKTVITVTHDINTAVLTAVRILVLHRGRLTFDGKPEKLMRGDVLERIYGRPFRFTTHPDTGTLIALPGVYL